ncbi:MAG: endonuclease/exonuclease/phosphatase family protein [Gammaproteobacteria bacterium]|nr:endonuclease/exonuclease/phosphatase family protein [Gammaproteobacteria bacterium]
MRLPRPQHFNPENSLRVLGRARHEQFDDEIRLLVWNIQKARRRNWFKDFVDLCHGQQLVILQEAVTNSEHDSFFENNRSYEWVMARSFRHRHNGIETGVKTGSTARSVEAESIFSPHTEPLLNTSKLVLATHYQLSRRTRETLLVLNVHAVNFVTLAKYLGQLEQLSHALSLHSGPVILAGDFNTWRPRRYKLFAEMAESAGLQEALMERNSRLQHLNQHLDHVYYRDLSLIRIHSLNQIHSSDHFPISVEFEID